MVKKLHTYIQYFVAFLVFAALAFSMRVVLDTAQKIQNGSESLDSVRVYEQVGDGPRILVAGDSLAFGVGASSAETSFAGQIGKKIPAATIVNKADIGALTKDLAELAPSIFDDSYDATFIIIGGNDIIAPAIDLQESSEHLRSIVSAATKRGGEVYLITSGDFANVSILPIDPGGVFAKRSQTLRDAALSVTMDHENSVYIDTFNLSADDYSALEADDGFHLNDMGIERLVSLLDFGRFVD